MTQNEAQDDQALRVVDVPDRQQFEIARGDEVLGHIAYERNGSVVTLTHTEVDPSTKGQGIGGRLVRGTLDHVREQGLSVQPDCSFVRAWMDSHPEYADLDHRHAGEGTA